MIGIGFWNVHKNLNIDGILQEMIVERKCDILILAEYENSADYFCNALSLKGKDFYVTPLIGCERIKIVADKAIQSEAVFDARYFTIQNFTYFDRQFLITALHFPSKLYAGSGEHMALACEMIHELEQAEQQAGHKNTILIGDFNANPFEEMCINANCFHGVPDASEAMKKKRMVNSYTYEMFYNPMWNFFGDRQKPGGTYYCGSAGIRTYFWNVFDQVMFRPQMLQSVKQDSLEIITTVQGHSLLNGKGVPDKETYSDHLPIFFQIEEEKLYG